MNPAEEELAAVEACTTIPALTETFQRIIEGHGFASFGFMDASKPWETNPLLVATHSQKWIDTYRAENFLATDPCLEMARRSNLPFNWGSVPLPSPRGRHKQGALRTMEAARDFGVAEGLTIPVHYCDQLGRYYSSVCALFWKDKVTAFFANLRVNRLHMHVIVLYMTQKIIDLYAAEQRLAPRFDRFAEEETHPLTDREKEVLKWAGLGKTSDETAAILNCSRKTVEAHVKNAMVKLGAVNKTQATVLAVYRGFISV